MAEYLIERGVPVPPGRTRMGSNSFPFANMEVDDSFFVPEDAAKNARSSSGSFAKRHGVKFTVRRTNETDEAGQNVAGVRVWRTE